MTVKCSFCRKRFTGIYTEEIHINRKKFKNKRIFSIINCSKLLPIIKTLSFPQKHISKIDERFFVRIRERVIFTKLNLTLIENCLVNIPYNIVLLQNVSSIIISLYDNPLETLPLSMCKIRIDSIFLVPDGEHEKYDNKFQKDADAFTTKVIKKLYLFRVSWIDNLCTN